MNPRESWRERWKMLDKLQLEFWNESYSIETPDQYGAEMETEILTSLKSVKISEEHLHALISPSVPTIPEQMLLDGKSIRSGKFSKEEYLKKYWYSHGTWNGGYILTPELLEQDIALTQSSPEISTRQNIHHRYDARLSVPTRQLLFLLRTLALWREERKAMQQRFALALLKVLKEASKELAMEINVLSWALYEEIEQAKQNPRQFTDRWKQSVFFVERGKKQGSFIIGKEARQFIKEFTNASTIEVKELRGTRASKGNARGMISVILRKEQFTRFPNNGVLVTTMTRPEFLPLMKKAVAIVTEEGGLTSHAAIIARELGKPCIVGVKHATRLLKDGDEVEVDAEKGIVRLLSTKKQKAYIVLF